MLQQPTRDWDKSVEVKQQVIDYFSRTPALQIRVKLTHRKWVPDRKSNNILPVGFSCPVYERSMYRLNGKKQPVPMPGPVNKPGLDGFLWQILELWERGQRPTTTRNAGLHVQIRVSHSTVKGTLLAWTGRTEIEKKFNLQYCLIKSFCIT